MNRIQFSASGAKYEALEVGVLTPGVGAGQQSRPVLRAGEVGYVHGAIKSVWHTPDAHTRVYHTHMHMLHAHATWTINQCIKLINSTMTRPS